MSTDAAAVPPKGRLLAGGGVFALGWIATLAMVPVITASSLAASAQTTMAGIVVFVGPKIGMLAAIAIMGKPGFTYLQAQVLGLLTPPAEVSSARHRLGIVMFVAAVLSGFVERYIGFFPPRDFAREIRHSLAIDLLLLASLLVLGGDFWDKIRALFIRKAKAQFPAGG